MTRSSSKWRIRARWRHDAEVGEGIGLRNAAERLRLLFGERASLDVDLSRPDMATTRVRIPVRA